MELNEINTIATATVAFVAVLSLMIAFYYNIRTYSPNTSLEEIIFLELVGIFTIIVFIKWIRRRLK